MTRLRADTTPAPGPPGAGVVPAIPLREWRRPDGRVYRPYRIVVDCWDGGDDLLGVWSRGAVVLGTFEYWPAFEWANLLCRSLYRRSADWESGRDSWVRSGYAGRRGDVSWVEDPVRGRPAVFFTACGG